jgi:hypothetical protein
MGIEIGFSTNGGFVDDRQEQEMWGKINEQLSEPKKEPVPASNTEYDGKIDIDETSEWKSDMANRTIKTYNKKKEERKQGFFQRNKTQIFDALIVLGVIYVGYKLFFEKDEEGGEMFDDGGSVDYTPTPQAPVAEPIVQAPPRPEMPEPTYNAE